MDQKCPDRVLRETGFGSLRWLCGALGVVLTLFGMASVGRADCRVVSIRSEKKIGAKVYVQYGVGTVFSRSPDDGKRYVFAPAHVVQSADSIQARCGQNEIPLTALAVSTTSDMAAFSAPKDSPLSPLFALDGATQKREIKYVSHKPFRPDSVSNTVLWNVTWGREETPDLIKANYVYFEGYRPDRPILGVEFGLYLGAFGVRPGMSGSPILAPDGSIVGIVTKTRNFGTQSAGISIESLKKHLPALIRGKDVFGPESKWAFYITESLTPSSEKGTLVRRRELHVGKGGGRVFTDVCPAHAYTETSFWSEAGGKSEWGDGGGDRDSSRIGGKYIRGSRKDFRGWQQFAMFRPDPDSCNGTGVRVPDGRILVAIKAPWQDDRDRIILKKVESIDDLYNILLLSGGDSLAKLNERGVFEARPASFDLICANKKLPPKGLQEALQPRINRDSIVVDNTPMELVDFAFKSMADESSGVSMNWTYSCDAQTHSLNVVSRVEPIELELKITNDNVSGRIKIGRCELSRIDQHKDLWSAQLKNERMHLELQVPSSEEGLLQIQVHQLDPACLEGFSPNGQKTFLDKLRWYRRSPNR